MKYREEWHDEYRNIRFSINKFAPSLPEYHESAWTYYLHIPLKQLPESVRERFWLEGEPDGITGKRIVYDYYKEPLMANIYWHGGITWYSKQSGLDGTPRSVKIGCDFQHLWDEYQIYSLEDVVREAHRTIDELHEAIPNIKKWCNYCGAYYVPSPDTKWCPDCMAKHSQQEEE